MHIIPAPGRSTIFVDRGAHSPEGCDSDFTFENEQQARGSFCIVLVVSSEISPTLAGKKSPRRRELYNLQFYTSMSSNESPLIKLLGPSLLSKVGKKVSTVDALRGKELVILYFSGT